MAENDKPAPPPPPPGNVIPPMPLTHRDGKPTRKKG